MIRCSSCGINLVSETNWVRFDCPQCGESQIVRCKRCRKSIKAYKCSECGFKGP